MPEPNPFVYDVFISYSHADKEWVRDELLCRLENAGFKVYIDFRDSKIGTPILTNIEYAVENSRHTILVLTPSYHKSEWCEFESLLVGVADITGRKQKFLPIVLHDCKLPSRIAMLAYADFTNVKEREEQFQRLVDQIKHASRSVTPPVTKPPGDNVGLPIIQPQFFFGRENELKRLFHLLQSPSLQNASIVGPRRSGKTSLLFYFKNIATAQPRQLRPLQRTDWLPQPERFRWCYVDFQDPRLGTRDGLLRYLLDGLGLPAPTNCTLEQFMEIVASNLRSPTVILLDEIGVAFERYAELDDPFWEAMRSLAGNQEVNGNLAFVMTGNKYPQLLAGQHGLGSPFFNIFGEKIELGPLAENEARDLIANLLIRLNPYDEKWMLTRSRRWPILLQVLCREYFLARENGETGKAWRKRGLEQMEAFRHLLQRSRFCETLKALKRFLRFE